MNERIQALAEQAGFYVADGKIYIPSTSEEITTCQKNFAELMVQECCNRLSKETIRHDGYGYNQHALYRILREHFGVEE
jgi:hypothetical protein